MNNHLKKSLIGLGLVGAGSAVTANGFVMDKLANRSNDLQIKIANIEEDQADISSLSKINNQWQLKNKKEEMTNHELTTSNQKLKNEIENKVSQLADLDRELTSKRKQITLITASLDKAIETYAKYQKPSRGHRA